MNMQKSMLFIVSLLSFSLQGMLSTRIVPKEVLRNISGGALRGRQSVVFAPAKRSAPRVLLCAYSGEPAKAPRALHEVAPHALCWALSQRDAVSRYYLMRSFLHQKAVENAPMVQRRMNHTISTTPLQMPITSPSGGDTAHDFQRIVAGLYQLTTLKRAQKQDDSDDLLALPLFMSGGMPLALMQWGLLSQDKNMPDEKAAQQLEDSLKEHIALFAQHHPINYCDGNQRTLLHHAYLATRGNLGNSSDEDHHKKLIQCIIQHGANPALLDNQGKKPDEYSNARGRKALLLAQAGVLSMGAWALLKHFYII